MSDGLKVAEVFTAIGFQVDRGDLRKAEKEIDGLAQRTEKKLQRATSPFAGRSSHAAMRESMRREAALWKSEQIRKQRIHERLAIDSHKRVKKAVAEKRGRGVFGAGLGIAGGLTGLAALGIGLGAKEAFGNALAFDEQVNRLDVSAGGAMGSTGDIRQRLLEVSKASGIAKEELLQGAASFVALTGDGKAASESLATFAKVQTATGASMQDISGAAASLTQQLGIGAGEFERAFSILVAGGKAGKVELKDMAALMAPLSASFKQFGDSQGTGGLATLSGAFQVSARNFGSASEAATGLESLMGSLIQNSKKLKKEGVDVFGEDGSLRSLKDIVDSLAGKGFNPTKVIDLLGRKEAFATFQALRDNRQEWERIAQSSREANDIATDAARVQATSAFKLRAAWNSTKVALADALDPERVAIFTTALAGTLGVAAALIDTLSRPTILGDKVTDLADAIFGTASNAFGGTRQPDGVISGAFRGLSTAGLGMNTEGPITGAINTARNFLSTGGSGAGDMLSPSFFDPRVEEPFVYTPPGGGAGGTVINSNVSLKVEAGADPRRVRADHPAGGARRERPPRARRGLGRCAMIAARLERFRHALHAGATGDPGAAACALDDALSLEESAHLAKLAVWARAVELAGFGFAMLALSVAVLADNESEPN